MNLIYVDVDDKGTIVGSEVGPSFIPTKRYDYFFIDDDEVAFNLSDYKVVLDGYKSSLVKNNDT